MRRRPNDLMMKPPELPPAAAPFPLFVSFKAASSARSASASGSCSGAGVPPSLSFRLMSRPRQRNISVGSFTTSRFSSLANTP